MKEKEYDDEDREAVLLSKRGNADAFELLVKRHQKMMLNIAYRMIGNYEDACEVVQDAFVSAYKNITGFEEKALFSTWLSAIVVNLSRNRLKQLHIKNCREEYSLDDPVLRDDGQITIQRASREPSALEVLEKKDIRQKVEECMNSLDNEFKEVLILRDIRGFSHDEIVMILKIPEGTVKSRLFRARGALRDCLKNVSGVL